MTDRNAGEHRTTAGLQDTIRWKNTAAAAVPAYGVIQLRTNFVTGYSQANKPNSSSGLFYVNGAVAVAVGAYGESQLWSRPQLVQVSGTVVVGDEIGPSSDSWVMSAGGSGYRVIHQNVSGIASVVQVSGGGGTHEIWFTIISVECPTATKTILTVQPTWYTGGCTAAIPGTDSYGYVTVEDVCSILSYYTAVWLVGKTGRATYMYPRTGTCTPKWLVDTICGTPECA